MKKPEIYSLLNKERISFTQNINNNFILIHVDDLNFQNLSLNKKLDLSTNEYSLYLNKLNFESLVQIGKLNEEQIIFFEDKINLNHALRYFKFSETFLNDRFDQLNPVLISEFKICQ